MVVGTANPLVWTQVATQQIVGGQIMLLVKLTGDGENGSEVLEEIKRNLIEVTDLGQLIERLEGIEAGLRENLSWDVLAVVLRGEQLLVAGKGAVGLYLRRGEKFARLIEGGEVMSGVSGVVEPGDLTVLTTDATSKVITEVGWERLDEQESLEQLAVRVHGQEDSSAMALMVGTVLKDLGEQRRVDWGRVVQKVKGLGKRPVKIREEQKRRNVAVGVGLLLILLVGVMTGVVQRSTVIKEQNYQKTAAQVASKITEAKSIADLNPERAKGLLSEARGEVESYLSRIEDDEYVGRGQELSEEIVAAEQEVFREEEVQINTLTELSLLKVEGSQLMVGDSEGNLMLLGERGANAAGINVEDKSSWQVETELSEPAVDVSVYNERLYLLTNSGVEGLNSRGGGRSKEIEPDEMWAEPGRIATFAGNVYVLDRGQSEIWKYPVLNEGFGARKRWFGAGITLDLSRVVNWEVDGDIWIVTSTGKLERYSLGVPVLFEMEGFPAVEAGRLSRPMAVATTENRVYVLEAGAGRVVVFEKESGKYEKQLSNEVFSEGKELVVYENRGYVLLDDRIGWFEL